MPYQSFAGIDLFSDLLKVPAERFDVFPGLIDFLGEFRIGKQFSKDAISPVDFSGDLDEIIRYFRNFLAGDLNFFNNIVEFYGSLRGYFVAIFNGRTARGAGQKHYNFTSHKPLGTYNGARILFYKRNRPFINGEDHQSRSVG